MTGFRKLFASRPLALGVGATLVAAVAMAVPTAVVANPFFFRMTPVRPLDYGFWVVSSTLFGLIAATFGVPNAASDCQTRTIGGGLLNTLAIGCPICNKLVVALLGVSGALAYWSPLQPLVGLAAVSILGWTFMLRLYALDRGASQPTS